MATKKKKLQILRKLAGPVNVKYSCGSGLNDVAIGTQLERRFVRKERKCQAVNK